VGTSRRKFIVFSSLIGVLTLTSAALLALAPAPLTSGTATSLFAVEAPQSLDAIFSTATPAAQGQWKYIYVHHSRTLGGNATTLPQAADGLGDHFLIGNGEGSVDGEIQVSQRWNHQLPAAPPAANARIDPACISVCLVGDFDRGLPSPIQLRRLGQLVGTLQARFGVPSDAVLVVDQPESEAGIGRYFPTSAFRQSLLPGTLP
jgi:hypothetical protein